MNLKSTITDVCSAILTQHLGSIENVVIDSACKTVITEWNTHHTEQIDTRHELAEWSRTMDGIRTEQLGCGNCEHCSCGESH